MIAFDILLGVGIILAATGAFISANLFRSVVMFVVFGVLLAIVWVRLQAPDLALAEAAIGAGLTGVLLLDTLSVLRQQQRLPMPTLPWWWRSAAAAAAVAVLVALHAALLNSPKAVVDLPSKVAAAIPEAGIEHPITAVLLNFRSYDTLLEVAVLLVAVVIGLSLRLPDVGESTAATSAPTTPAQGPAERDPILLSFSHRLIPLVLLTAGYVLWAGSTMPGGAFQAGALIAAAGVIGRLAGYNIAGQVDQLLRFGLVLGFLVFLAVAVSTMVGGRPFLNYPDGWAGSLIFLIEAMLTFSIGLTLLSLFVHAPGQVGGRNDR